MSRHKIAGSRREVLSPVRLGMLCYSVNGFYCEVLKYSVCWSSWILLGKKIGSINELNYVVPLQLLTTVETTKILDVLICHLLRFCFNNISWCIYHSVCA